MQYMLSVRTDFSCVLMQRPAAHTMQHLDVLNVSDLLAHNCCKASQGSCFQKSRCCLADSGHLSPIIHGVASIRVC